MPAEFERLVDRLKGQPGVNNPYALAHAIEAHKERAKIARLAHRKKQEEEQNAG
jgi:hypothetical protein